MFSCLWICLWKWIWSLWFTHQSSFGCVCQISFKGIFRQLLYPLSKNLKPFIETSGKFKHVLTRSFWRLLATLEWCNALRPFQKPLFLSPLFLDILRRIQLFKSLWQISRHFLNRFCRQLVKFKTPDYLTTFLLTVGIFKILPARFTTFLEASSKF